MFFIVFFGFFSKCLNLHKSKDDHVLFLGYGRSECRAQKSSLVPKYQKKEGGVFSSKKKRLQFQNSLYRFFMLILVLIMFLLSALSFFNCSPSFVVPFQTCISSFFDFSLHQVWSSQYPSGKAPLPLRERMLLLCFGLQDYAQPYAYSFLIFQPQGLGVCLAPETLGRGPSAL